MFYVILRWYVWQSGRVMPEPRRRSARQRRSAVRNGGVALRPTLLLLLFASFVPAGAQTHRPPRDECTETAELNVLLKRDPTTVAVKGFPIPITANRAALVIHRCGAPRPVEQKLTSSQFAWKVEGPGGAAPPVSPATSTSVHFVATAIGEHTVRFTACPKICKVLLRIATTPQGKPVNEVVDIGPEAFTLKVQVDAQAQLPPLFDALRPDEKDSEFQATVPKHYGAVRDACGNRAAVGAGRSPQWLTTTTWTSPTPPYTLAEGRVYHVGVSRKDDPVSHNFNDATMNLELDPHYRNLLVDDTPEDEGALLPFGGIEIEWEYRQWNEAFWPVVGDRASVFGFHNVDCGHEKYTEIHPPIAVAIHRARPVLLPSLVALSEGGPKVHPGENVLVPGIVTDILVNLNGGKTLDCGRPGLHQPEGVCVSQPTTAGARFVFNVFLPTSPFKRLRDLGLNPPVKPALFVSIENHPQAPTGARSDLPVALLETRTDGDHPYARFSVDLSSLATGQRFAKRIRTAWVYPDIQGSNFGLQPLRVRFDSLQVTDDGDPTGKGDGDWRFWIGKPSADTPWTRLLECNGCIEKRTYTPADGPWSAGALLANGHLRGEVLLFAGQFAPFQSGGFEEDLVTSDDTGRVLTTFFRPVHRQLKSECNDQTAGGLNDVDPSTSGCAAYTIEWTVERGVTPVSANLSAETKAFLQKLIVGRSMVENEKPQQPTELYGPEVTDNRKRLTVRRPDEQEFWQDFLQSEEARTRTAATAAAVALAKEARARALAMLGKNPTPQRRKGLAEELRALKKVLPPAVYRANLCDLETGAPCLAQ